MVDARATLPAERKAAALPAATMRASVAPAAGPALHAHSELAARGIAAPAQGAAWVEAWTRNVGGDTLLAMLQGSRTALSLPLQVERVGPIAVASFMGGRHANGNFPAVDPEQAPALTRRALAALFADIKAARPDIDVIRLERMTDRLGTIANPLLQFDHRASPNLSLAVSLEGGFEAVLERSSAKRKRKKHRSQTRKFEAAGGFRRVRASTPQEVQRLLAAFLDMKEQRFRKMGIANVFGDAAIRRFFLELFAASTGQDAPAFVLDGLEVGGKLRAVTGSSTCGDRLICEFGAISEDDLTATSPGDFLFFENISQAADAGYAIYDFSVGDEPYKRLWCDVEITQYDVLVPLTPKGRATAAALRALAMAKSALKNSPTLWRIAKRLRKETSGLSAKPDGTG